MENKAIDIKRLSLWSLYDFAHHIVLIVFFLYYSEWLVIEKGVSDFWFNMTFVGSSILFLLTVPVAGSIADKFKVNLPGLRVTTLFSVLFFFLTGMIATFYPNHYVWSVITFSLATYFYLFCFTFYHPLLKDVAAPERQGLASGWGQFGDWLGEISGLLITLPLATGTIIWWQSSLRAQPLMPAALLFLIFSLPMLLYFKEKNQPAQVTVNIKQEYKGVLRSFIKLCRLPGTGLFLLAYFFFNDAVTTASNNFPIYVQKLFGVNDEIQSYLLIAILIGSAIGAPICGLIADKIGFKKTLIWVLGGWVLIFPAMAVTHNLIVFSFICFIMGLWFGSIWTITRAYLLRLTPPSMLNQSFTYYTLMERLATLIGPVSWSLIIAYGPKAIALNYRMPAVAMAGFVLIGLLIARKLPDPSTEKI